MKAIISGGGTGGHIFPAIAIANCLKRRYEDCRILFVGAEGKMEMQKVPQAGYDIVGLKIAGFQRKKLWKNFSLPFKMISASLKARKIIKDFSPDIVIGVGGYTSWATLREAQKLGIPTLLQEQNSFAGKSNMQLSSRAQKICVAYDDMQRFFSIENIVKTGNPVRKNISAIRETMQKKRQDALKTYNFNGEKTTVLVMGGSLGAGTINQAVENHLDYFFTNDIQLIWQTGKFYYNDIYERNKERLKEYTNVRITEFITDMEEVYSLADIIVSRAGALAISELCCVGKPVVLIPSPNVAEDHQRKNAMALVEKEAAKMILDSEADKKITEMLDEIINNGQLRERLGKNILSLAIVDSDERIVDEAEKIIGK
ncbi:MAG: undecaprenyldiphospho-muramoylpentapeptide beta-N-acetylglucosaminyltransferase [Bacteroidales bacterium]|nr:undecaprenyldiphospho-muramoylpentapeptide beta-N-acetylglucosaminyltransferase [Bacteroidales bacterium]